MQSSLCEIGCFITITAVDLGSRPHRRFRMQWEIMMKTRAATEWWCRRWWWRLYYFSPSLKRLIIREQEMRFENNWLISSSTAGMWAYKIHIQFNTFVPEVCHVMVTADENKMGKQCTYVVEPGDSIARSALYHSRACVKCGDRDSADTSSSLQLNEMAISSVCGQC